MAADKARVTQTGRLRKSAARFVAGSGVFFVVKVEFVVRDLWSILTTGSKRRRLAVSAPARHGDLGRLIRSRR